MNGLARNCIKGEWPTQKLLEEGISKPGTAGRVNFQARNCWKRKFPCQELLEEGISKPELLDEGMF